MIPLPMTTWIAGGVVALAIAAAGVQTVRLSNEKADFAEARSQWADTRAEAERMRAKAESVQRQEENRRQQEKDHAIVEAKTKLAAMANDLMRADRAAVSLRDAARTAAKRSSEASGSAAPGGGSSPAQDPARVLADVLASIDERAGILAKIAGERGIAGATCERSYDSLTP